MTQIEKHFLASSEAAEFLRVKVATIYKWTYQSDSTQKTRFKGII